MPDRITPLVLAEIVGIAADAIICVDEAQRITFFNQGAESIFGYSREEIIGQRIELLIPERARHGHEAQVREFGRSGVKARRMGERREIAAVRKNGEEFPAEAAIAQLHHDNLTVYAVVLRDVTQRKRFEDLIQRGLQLRDDMVGIVSHDLRNPVAAIKMLAGAMLRGEDSVPLAETFANLAVIRTAAEEMEALISDLLDVTRLEAGRLQVHMEPVDASELAGQALATLAPLAHQRSLELITDFDENAADVLADRARIQQVLSISSETQSSSRLPAGSSQSAPVCFQPKSSSPSPTAGPAFHACSSLISSRDIGNRAGPSATAPASASRSRKE